MAEEKCVRLKDDTAVREAVCDWLGDCDLVRPTRLRGQDSVDALLDAIEFARNGWLETEAWILMQAYGICLDRYGECNLTDELKMAFGWEPDNG